MDGRSDLDQELATLRAENARLRAELEREQAIVKVLFDENPDGIAIAEADGRVRTNPAGTLSTEPVEASSLQSRASEWTSFGFFEADRKTPMALENMPLFRAMRGESPQGHISVLVTPQRPEGITIENSARPLPGGAAIAVYRDISDRVRLEEDLRTRNEALARREAENRELIERLRVALDELSTPVLEVAEDVLVLPVIGLVDTQRSAQMSERLLAEVVRTRARHVIVDLTGVEIIDTGTADRFAKLARAVELLGARCMLSGLQPAVAQSLVELGVDLGAIETQRNLRYALDACLAATKNGSASARKARRPTSS